LKIYLLLLLQVLEGSTDPSAGPALVAAGNTVLAAASISSSSSSKAKGKGGSRKGSPQGLAVKGSGLGLRAGVEVQLRGTWEQHETYGWQIK
jgi:hypothetical protein